jgi:hypothetical protein
MAETTPIKTACCASVKKQRGAKNRQMRVGQKRKLSQNLLRFAEAAKKKDVKTKRACPASVEK